MNNHFVSCIPRHEVPFAGLRPVLEGALSNIMKPWERLAHRVLVILDGFPHSLLEAFQTLKLSAQLLHLTIVEFYQNISNVHLEQDSSTVLFHLVSIDFIRFQQSK